MRTDLFDYRLPPELVAQEPLRDRSASRLMVVDRSTGSISHGAFSDVPGLLDAGDCLVVNTSRVFPGRLEARKAGTGGRVELLLLERLEPGCWEALTRGASLRPGVRLELPGTPLMAEITETAGDGKARLTLSGAPPDDIEGLLFGAGRVPLPPYIKGDIPDPERYQTVYAEREIAAAAPTAGLHFTEGLLDQVRRRGVSISGLELAVGMDTFVPVREEQVEDHAIHSEWFNVTGECAREVNRSVGRVVAVGTTVVRALETASAAAGQGERVSEAAGRTPLYITPGYSFKAVDGLVTNFHIPRSTLLMLVCAFGGTGLIMEAYERAVSAGYRFYSFGDAMMVV